MVGLVSSFFPLFTSKAGELKDGGVLGLDDTRIIWNLMELLRLYIYIYTCRRTRCIFRLVRHVLR